MSSRQLRTIGLLALGAAGSTDPPPDRFPTAGDDPSSRSLTVLDWIGLVVVLLLALLLASTPVTVSPQFRRMFADFGGSATLPGVTVVALSNWFAPAAALLPLTLAAAGALIPATPLALRRGLIVASFVLVLLGGIGYCWGLYAPIVQLAGAVGA